MDLDGVELLSEHDCRELLRRAQVGRVAVSVGEVPAVFPVNYMVAGDEILFFTAEGTKLRAATTERTVTFEVDHVDLFTETGWSVMVVGRARERTESDVVVGAQRAGLRSWAAGDRFHLISVAIDLVSGRRIGAPVDRRDRAAGYGEQFVGPHSPVVRLAQPPVWIGADWTLQSAADTMRAATVSAVLVDADDAIVTERDLTRALSGGLGPQEKAAAIGVTDLVYVDEDTTVVEAAIHLFRDEIRHLLVRNRHGEVTGVILLRDVVRVLVEAMDPAVWVQIRQTQATHPLRRSHR